MTSHNILKKIETQINQFIELTGKAISWFTLIMVMIQFAVVLLRYGFEIGSIALQESITYLHATVFLLCAAYTLKHNEHVRVDIFYRRLNDKRRAQIDLLGSLLLLQPVCWFMFISCWDYVINSWRIMEVSAEAGGIPAIFLLKTLMLLCAVLLSLQGFAESIRNYLITKGSGHTKTNSGIQTV